MKKQERKLALAWLFFRAFLACVPSSQDIQPFLKQAPLARSVRTWWGRGHHVSRTGLMPRTPAPLPPHLLVGLMVIHLYL